MSNLTRSIIRTFSTQVGCQVIAIVSGIVIARMIGPAGKGFVSYAATGLSFVSVFFYGFTDAILYQFGKQKLPARTVHATAVKIYAAIMAVVIAVFVTVAILVPSQRPLAAAAAAVPFAIYIQLMTPFFMIRDKMLFLNMQTLGQSLGVALLTIPLLLFAHAGLMTVIAVWVFCYFCAAMSSMRGMRSILATPGAAEEPAETIMRDQLHFGMRAAGGSTAGFINMRISIFMVSIMFAPVQLGWYTLAIGTGEMLWQVSRAFAWSALGRIGADSLPDAAALVSRITRNTLAIVGCLGIVAFVIGPKVIVLVYGAKFAPAGEALRWALPGLVAYAAEVALTKFIILQLRRPLTIIGVQLGAAALSAALTFAGAARFGIVAAAAATSISYLIVTVVLLTIFLRGTNVSAYRLLVLQPEDVDKYAGTLGALLRTVRRTLRLRSA